MSKLQELIQLSDLAIKYVDAIMGPHGGAPNKPGEIRDSVKVNTGFEKFDDHITQTKAKQVQTDLEARMKLIRDEFAKAHPAGPDPWTAGKLNQMALLAIKHRAGQCNEQVAIAFHHLRGWGVKMIDLMVLQPRPPVDHTFLIINFGKPDAVVCDPWSPWKNRRAYAATEQNLKQNMQMHRASGAASAFTWYG
jgi:hypothetical protein